MQGDPFSSVRFIDRAKLVYFGVRDYFLGVVEREKKEFEASRIVPEPALILHADDECPQCRTPAAMREIAGAGTRCFQCGFQPKVFNPLGSPTRKDLENWRGYSPEHQAKFKAGFGNAVARIVGRK